MSRVKRSIPTVVPVLLVAVLMFVYCGDSDETAVPVDSLVGAALCLSDSSCALNADCDTSTAISITNCGNDVTLDWSAIKTGDWFSLSSEAGTTPGGFTVTADTNATSSARTGLIVITADGISGTPETLSVSQPLIESDICLSTDEWTCAAGGDTSWSVVVTNCGNSSVFSWTAVSDSSWLSMSPAGGDTPGEFVMVADSNSNGTERTATVTVTASGLTDVLATITVTQPTLEPTVCVSLSQWDAPSLGGDSPTISVTNCGDASSLNWEVAEDLDWLTLSVSSGSTPGSFTVTADTNNTGLTRTGTVIVTAVEILGIAWTITVDQPGIIASVGSYDTPGQAWSVYVSGDYAYVADGSSGLLIADISNPAVPAFVGSYDTPGVAYGVNVTGDYAFVADGTYGGLQIIDVSNPSSPAFVGSYDTPGAARGVIVTGDYAYVADGSYDGLQIIDVSNPPSPAFVGSYDTPGEAYGVTVTGDYAFVADSYAGLQIIDISDPSSPAFVGSYDTPGAAYCVTVAGDYAYMADGYSGLQIIDITNPSDPVRAGNRDTPGLACGVFVSGDYAYVADEVSGLQIIDVSDPSSPVLAGSYVTPGYAWGVYVSGDYTYVADWYDGLLILELASDLTD